MAKKKDQWKNRIVGEGVIPAEQLKANPKNWRTHGADQRKTLDSALDEIGGIQRVIVNKTTGNIVDGHLRVEQAVSRGEDVPVLYVELTEAEEMLALATIDPISAMAGSDQEMVDQVIESIQTEDESLLELIEGLRDEPLQKVGKTDPDDVPEVPEKPITQLGDIWILGDHRLMCGDSTNIEDVKMLMDDHKADMVFTDPPYNVAFNGRSGKHEVIKNDDLSDDEFKVFIDGVIKTIKLIKPKVYYIWCNWKFYGILQGKLEYKSCIVWAKNVFGMGNGYRHQHEFCLFNGKIDENIKNESDLWGISKDSNYMHPTQKPVELSVRAFGNHKKLLNIVDLFGGSGSTLIGAEQCGRKSFLMELDPKYCDVIIKRYQDYTGGEAIHEDGTVFNDLEPG